MSSLKYNRSLDGLRGLAILLVLSFHGRFWASGWMGIQLFFVLSGFLISKILIQFKQLPCRSYFTRFYFRRVLRIFPLYYAYLTAVSFAYLLFATPKQFSSNLVYLATFSFNWTRSSKDWQHSPYYTHFWSLAVEEQFYLIWPCLIYFLSLKRVQGLCLAVIAVSPLLRYFFAFGYEELQLSSYAIGDSIYWNTLCQADAFAVGALVASMPEGSRTFQNYTLLPYLALLLLLLLGLASLGSQDSPLLTSFGYAFPLYRAAYQHVWGYTLINFTSATLLLHCLRNTNSGIFSTMLLVEFGRVSYGIYVLHWSLMDIFQRVLGIGEFTGRWGIDLQGVGFFLVYLCVVFLLARISYVLLEKPFLKLKSFYDYQTH